MTGRGPYFQEKHVQAGFESKKLPDDHCLLTGMANIHPIIHKGSLLFIQLINAVLQVQIILYKKGAAFFRLLLSNLLLDFY